MAEVLDTPVDSLDRRRNRHSDSSPEHHSASPPPQRRRERDSRERKEDRDFDRAPNRREYYNRNRPSPPSPRERDRYYKRRFSPSPPPYRNRRRSPPFGPYKRYKRDNGGYEGRRGSPRGGYGPGDRRFGYDYTAGYDREMGGRPSYADDRRHGRYFRRSGGYPDWDSGRGGYNDLSIAGSISREGLMTYKQFIQELEDDVLPSEAERRYQEYRLEYISTQKRTYFEAHKDEEWLRDKYHPTNLLSVIERRNERARKVAKDFLLDLHSGALEIGPAASASAVKKSGQTSDPNSEDEADVGGKRRRHSRVPANESDISAAPKAHPVSSEQRRIQTDIELAQALVTKLDSEKGIEDNILSKDDNDKRNRDKSRSGSSGPVIIIRGLTSVKGLEGVELLDTLVTYLWRVHGVDYYGLIETPEPKGMRHVRAEAKSVLSSTGAEWEKKLDSHWEERLRSLDPLETMTAKEKIDAAAVEVLDPYVRKIRDEKYGWKYGCGAKGCTKLFHAAEYVHKHLKLKHPDLVMELTAKVREDIYFQNYMNDLDAPGSQPVMQQFVPKDKIQKRRLPAHERLKFDRGNLDARGNGGRFDGSDNPQGGDSQSNNDDPDTEDADEPMSANLGVLGAGIRGAAPFATDVPPPPVLMPVPGAGPLGPFVPAPPEVAIRMLREQGGAPPPSVLNGRLGPPVILPPSLNQDPRRLRSYQDLDAPEDEVSVIDYRSL